MPKELNFMGEVDGNRAADMIPEFLMLLALVQRGICQIGKDLIEDKLTQRQTAEGLTELLQTITDGQKTIFQGDFMSALKKLNLTPEDLGVVVVKAEDLRDPGFKIPVRRGGTC